MEGTAHGKRRGRSSSEAAADTGTEPPGGTQRTEEPAPLPPTTETILDMRRHAPPPAAPASTGQTQLGRRRVVDEVEPKGSATHLGARRSAAPRGVAAAPATAPGRQPRPAPRRRLSRLLGVLNTAVALVLVGVALWMLFGRTEPLVARAATVAPATPLGDACDVTVDIVGTITTNGEPGSVRYQWIRSDGQTSAELVQPVERGATTAQVHLLWTLSGRGTYQAQAVLRVLEPAPSEVAGGFTYRCQ